MIAYGVPSVAWAVPVLPFMSLSLPWGGKSGQYAVPSLTVFDKNAAEIAPDGIAYIAHTFVIDASS